MIKNVKLGDYSHGGRQKRNVILIKYFIFSKYDNG